MDDAYVPSAPFAPRAVNLVARAPRLKPPAFVSAVRRGAFLHLARSAPGHAVQRQEPFGPFT